MNTNTSKLRVLALFSLVATLGPVAVRAQPPLEFTVPFDFTVGSTTFTHGDYRVSAVVPGVLSIRSEEDRTAVMVMTQNREPARNSGPGTMTFRKYGERYFLAKVADPSHGWELPKSPGEKEIAAQLGSPKPLAVIASSRR